MSLAARFSDSLPYAILSSVLSVAFYTFPKSSKSGQDGNSGTQFSSEVKFIGVAFCARQLTRNVTNRRLAFKIFAIQDANALFDLYLLSWDLESTV